MTTTLQNYRQIIATYGKNKYFLLSSALMILSFIFAVPIAKIWEMPYFGNGGRIETEFFILFNVMFSAYILTLGWPLILGTMLKSQFAHPRASLYPAFRFRHLMVSFVLYLIYQVFIGMTMARLTSHYSTEGFTLQMPLIMLFSSLLFIWLGYLYHFAGLGTGFIFLVLFIQFMVGVLNSSPQILFSLPPIKILFTLTFFALVLLGWRIWKLSEEKWEYRFEQVGWLGKTNPFFPQLKYMLGSARLEPLWGWARRISKYPYRSIIWIRARHWSTPIGGGYFNIFTFVIFLATAVGILLFSTKDYLASELSKIQLPFFIYIGLLGLSQNAFSPMKTAEVLLKPFPKRRLVLEFGLAQLIIALEAFIGLIFILWILPALVYKPSLLWEGFLWPNVALAFASVIFWFGLSAIVGKFFNQSISQLVPSGGMLIISFLSAEWFKHLPLMKVFGVGVALLLAGIVLLRIAYCLWCDLKFPELKRRVAIISIYLLILGLATYGFLNYRPSYAQVIDYPDYIVYVPDHLNYRVKHPLVIALSPTSDAKAMIRTWEKTADQFQWIVLASKRFHSEIDWCSETGIYRQIKADVARGYLSLPIDGKKILASGFSAGAWGSYDFAYEEDDFISGLVLNTGMMNEDFMTSENNRYPRDKFAVFLASPTDFRYKEMQLNEEFLQSNGWRTKWIEFQGGHTLAPKSAYWQAAKWTEEQWKNIETRPRTQKNEDSE